MFVFSNVKVNECVDILVSLILILGSDLFVSNVSLLKTNSYPLDKTFCQLANIQRFEHNRTNDTFIRQHDEMIFLHVCDIVIRRKLPSIQPLLFLSYFCISIKEKHLTSKQKIKSKKTTSSKIFLDEYFHNGID